MLYMIGIGLNDEKDISIKGLEAIKRCKKVYLESYTSKLQCKTEDLEKLYGKKIILADRDMVEKNAETTILEDAFMEDTAFLVIGDVFGATTHTDLRMRAHDRSIPVKIIHNASVLTATGLTGLELYKFGKTTSIPFENENIETPYQVLESNQKQGLHTLFLLDLRPDENRFMSVEQAINYLLRLEEKHKKGLFTKDTMVIGCSKLGSDDNYIAWGKASEVMTCKWSFPPECLIVPGKLHFMEEDVLNMMYNVGPKKD